MSAKTEGSVNVVLTNMSGSLYNCSLSAGWTRPETRNLRLGIMKYGIGNWQSFDNCLLTDKTHSQIVCETQRMLGQQSMKTFYKLHVDPYRVGKDNAMKTDVCRKSGLITNNGPTLTPNQVGKLRQLNTERYGVPEQDISEIYIPPLNKNESAPVQLPLRTQKLVKLQEYKTELKKCLENLKKIRDLKAQGKADKDIHIGEDDNTPKKRKRDGKKSRNFYTREGVYYGNTKYEDVENSVAARREKRSCTQHVISIFDYEEFNDFDEIIDDKRDDDYDFNNSDSDDDFM